MAENIGCLLYRYLIDPKLAFMERLPAQLSTSSAVSTQAYVALNNTVQPATSESPSVSGVDRGGQAAFIFILQT